jgi:hypothetical protein
MNVETQMVENMEFSTCLQNLQQRSKVDIYGFPFFFHHELKERLLNDTTLELNLYIPNPTTQEFYLMYEKAEEMLRSLRSVFKCCKNIYILNGMTTHSVTFSNYNFVFDLDYPSRSVLIDKPRQVLINPYNNIGEQQRLEKFDISCILGFRFGQQFQKYQESNDDYWQRLFNMIKQSYPFVIKYFNCSLMSYNTPVMTVVIKRDAKFWEWKQLLSDYPIVRIVNDTSDIPVDKM